jgi:hypothetical protein
MKKPVPNAEPVGRSDMEDVKDEDRIPQYPAQPTLSGSDFSSRN